ncbi:MAG: tetratricopeptide repeat protein, partial [Actinobacteria bacterium]|nr:tetratricopeptide repeat protein [Actinomycetota bacterium]
RERLGPDDPATLGAAHNLASVYQRLGHYTQAHTLAQDTLARSCSARCGGWW